MTLGTDTQLKKHTINIYTFPSFIVKIDKTARKWMTTRVLFAINNNQTPRRSGKATFYNRVRRSSFREPTVFGRRRELGHKFSQERPFSGIAHSGARACVYVRACVLRASLITVVLFQQLLTD